VLELGVGWGDGGPGPVGKVRAHDLTVAQPVSDTHLVKLGVGPILPNEVLAQTSANIKLLVVLFAIFLVKYLYLYNRSTGSPERAAGRAGSAQNRREGVARDAGLHLYHDIARGSHDAS
jgi:hypothetical protein